MKLIINNKKPSILFVEDFNSLPNEIDYRTKGGSTPGVTLVNFPQSVKEKTNSQKSFGEVIYFA